MTTPKIGFNGQWVDIISTGEHTDNTGKKHKIDDAFLNAVVANFDATVHEPPAVVGHPKSNDPAYAWTNALRFKDGHLEAQFADVDSDFEQMVREKKFKKRSASFYLDPSIAPGGKVPSLQHVGFLGAKAPAVKGLRDIQFNEGEAITFEETINFEEGDSMTKEDEKTLSDRITESVKTALAALGFSKKEESPVSFTEAQLDERIRKAATAATAEFSQKATALQEQNKKLLELVLANTGASRKAEIASFCEKLHLPPAFTKLGVVEFMESLATVDAKVTVISFEEEANGTKKEIKTETPLLSHFMSFLESISPVIEFGERFGSLNATGASAVVVDPLEMEKLRAGTGTKGETAGGAK